MAPFVPSFDSFLLFYTLKFDTFVVEIASLMEMQYICRRKLANGILFEHLNSLEAITAS